MLFLGYRYCYHSLPTQRYFILCCAAVTVVYIIYTCSILYVVSYPYFCTSERNILQHRYCVTYFLHYSSSLTFLAVPYCLSVAPNLDLFDDFDTEKREDLMLFDE